LPHFVERRKKEKRVLLGGGFAAAQQNIIPDVIKRLTADLPGRLTLITGEKLEAILKEVRALNRDEERLADFLRGLNTQSASFVV